jgi:hypothetical protein
MNQARFVFPSLLTAMLAIAFAVPSADAQAPRPLPPGPQGQPPAPPRGQPPGPPPQQQQQQQQSQQPAPPRPYKPVAITLPQPFNDPSFEAFRKQLGDIIGRKDRAALARVIVASNFFWFGQNGDKTDKRKSGIDNFAAAVDLDAQDGSGWMALTDVVRDPTLEPVPDRQGVMCSPAAPTFDENQAEQLAKSTGTEPNEWAYTTKQGVEVHAAAQPNSPVIDRLGLSLVRVMSDDNQQSPMVRVVTPSGKVGFVTEDSLGTLENDQICYIKEGAAWKITGVTTSN